MAGFELATGELGELHVTAPLDHGDFLLKKNFTFKLPATLPSILHRSIHLFHHQYRILSILRFLQSLLFLLSSAFITVAYYPVPALG